MRGEKLNNTRSYIGQVGSPPHARGKVLGQRLKYCRKGITPACAGKSETLSRVHSGERDHPRMRGEKLSSL